MVSVKITKMKDEDTQWSSRPLSRWVAEEEQSRLLMVAKMTKLEQTVNYKYLMKIKHS